MSAQQPMRKIFNTAAQEDFAKNAKTLPAHEAASMGLGPSRGSAIAALLRTLEEDPAKDARDTVLLAAKFLRETAPTRARDVAYDPAKAETWENIFVLPEAAQQFAAIVRGETPGKPAAAPEGRPTSRAAGWGSGEVSGRTGSRTRGWSMAGPGG